MSARTALAAALLAASFAPLPTALPGQSIPPATTATADDCRTWTPGHVQGLYRTGQYKTLVDGCTGLDGLDLDTELAVLRSQARSGLGRAAMARAEALRAAQPGHAGVRATAATVFLSGGRFEEAADEVVAALLLDPREPEAWLARAVLALVSHDERGALAALDEAVRADPALRGAYTAYLQGIRASRASRDPAAMVRVLDDRAAHLERQGGSGHKERAHMAMLLQAPEAPLFTVETADDLVRLPFTPCYEGSVYRCIPMMAGGREFQVLLDTGNEPGWTLHHPDLLRLLPHREGGTSSISTGSVDTAMVGRRLISERVELAGATLHALPGHFYPKPRERYFDANLNPFAIQDRVVTLDYVRGEVLLRTKDRFDRDLAQADPATLARAPLYGCDWGFIPITVSGAPAWAMIETGAEVFQISREFAEAHGIPLKDATMEFRGREYHFHKAQVDARLGDLVLFSDTAHAWPAKLRDISLGLFYDAVIGPGLLEGRFVLSYDPFDRMVIVQQP
jgi:hypothetical protein